MQLLLLSSRILTLFSLIVIQKFSVKGSSREFVGFDTDLDESVISHIWKRVGEYFPKLRSLSLSDISESRKVRIGLRPYSELHSLQSFVWKMYLAQYDIFDYHNFYPASA
jgi:hypothetical protein